MKDLSNSELSSSPPFAWGKRTYIMGVINLTPDSFSGDGMLAGPSEPPERLAELVLAKAFQFVKDGADILDVGGESTRPGAPSVSVEEELSRVVPVIKMLALAGLKTLISVDTSKAAVAEAALEVGANWVNDVWGFMADHAIAKVVKKYQVPVILMHNRLRNTPTMEKAEVASQTGLGGRYLGTHYGNLIEDIKAELMTSVTLAHAAGIPDGHIILDPGIGFGKTVEQNLELLDRLDELRSLGYPLLVGPSRKSFIGYTLNLPPDQRFEGTAAAVAVSIVRGADMIRVHDVGAMARVVRMTDAIVRRGGQAR